MKGLGLMTFLKERAWFRSFVVVRMAIALKYRNTPYKHNSNTQITGCYATHTHTKNWFNFCLGRQTDRSTDR